MSSSSPSPLRRVADGVRDPWVLLTAALGGGLAWAIGIPAALALLITVAMLAGAGALTLVRAPERGALEGPRLRSGTQQAQLVEALEGYLRDLRRLRETKLPDAVTDSAIEALVAADGARQVAQRVAAAVDALDDALARSRQVSRTVGGAGDGVRATMARMAARREALLAKLSGAVTEVAEVYTKLLELSATVDTLSLGDGVGEVESVNASLDSLRGAFAELEADATSARELT